MQSVEGDSPLRTKKNAGICRKNKSVCKLRGFSLSMPRLPNKKPAAMRPLASFHCNFSGTSCAAPKRREPPAHSDRERAVGSLAYAPVLMGATLALRQTMSEVMRKRPVLQLLPMRQCVLPLCHRPCRGTSPPVFVPPAYERR